MDLEKSNRQWLKDVPFVSARFAVREVKEKLRVVSAVAAYLDDVAEVENALSKSLSKIGGHATSRNELLPGTAAAVENILKTCIQLNTRNHASYASTISQSVGKALPDYVKSNTSKASTIANRIQTSVEEFRKLKSSQQKLTERYTKLLLDTEQSIKARDAAFLESETGKEQNDKDDKSSGSFMNRSLNKVKMFAKITPEDNKRRLIERCKELMKEIDSVEHQLSNNSVRLKAFQADLKEEVGKSLCELRELEEHRLTHLKECLNKLGVADDFCIDRMSDNAAASVTQMSSVNAEVELRGIFSPIEATLAELANQVGELPENRADLIPHIDKLLESFEYTRSTLQRLHFGVLEVIEAEKNYCKSIHKVLDKHNRSSSSSSMANRRASATAASMGIGSASNALCLVETLQQLESPSTRGAWEQFVQSLSAKLELHSQCTELFTEKICVPLEAIVAALLAGKKELNDKKNSAIKCLDAAHANVSKLVQKLAKIEQFLKERRNTVKRAKEDLAPELDEADNDFETTSTGERVSSTLSDGEAAAGGGGSSGGATGPKAPGSMMKSLEKMRTTKLSVVVGLESKEDRISRIDSQISGLEEEKEELVAAHAAAVAALAVANDDVRRELTSAIKDAMSLQSKHVLSLPGTIFDVFVIWQNGSVEQHRRLSSEMRSTVAKTDVAKDVEHFVITFVGQADGSIARDNAAYVSFAPDIISSSDFAQLDLFERIPNELIDEERQMSSTFSGASSSSSAPKSAASNFASVVNAALSQHVGQSSAAATANANNADTPVRSESGSPIGSAEASPVSRHSFSASGDANGQQNNSIGNARSESPPLEPLPDAEIVKMVVKRDASNGNGSGKKHVASPTSAPVTQAANEAAPSAAAPAGVSESWGVAINDMLDEKKPAVAAVPVPAPASAVVDFGVASSNTADSLDGTRGSVASVETQTTPSLPSPFPNVTAPVTVVKASPVVVGAGSSMSSASTDPSDPSVEKPIVATEVKGVPSASSGTAGTTAKAASSTSSPPSKGDNRKTVKVDSAPIIAQNEMNNSFQAASPPPAPSNMGRGNTPSANISSSSSTVNYNNSQANAGDADHELAKFGLNSSDRVLESFSCALYPKKGLGLTHGRMYITQYFLAFQGWPDTRLLIPLSNIIGVEKMNTVGFIPNAILIKVENNEFFFGSFLDRDQCYQLLKSMSDVVKRIVELHGKDISTESRNLVIGLQKDGLGEILGSSASSSTASSASAVKSPETVVADAVDTSTSQKPPTPQNTHTGPSLSATSAATEPAAASAAAPPPPTAVAVEQPDEPNDNVVVGTTFSKNAIHLLTKETTNGCSADEAWKACWLQSSGFRDFLISEGDLEVEVGEWKPFSSSVPEDVSKLKFTFSRPCTYAHPRTTMLMFGPKNAPAKQTQFLYLWGRGSSKVTNFDDLSKCRPRRGLVLTMTQFDGIPMADMFKVLQYWAFEDTVGSSPGQPATLVSIGVHIHFIKSTLLKGQVVSGVRDELATLSKKYVAWSRARTEDYIATNEDSLPASSSSSAAGSGGVAGVGGGMGADGQQQHPLEKKRSSRRLSNASMDAAAAAVAASTGTPTTATESAPSAVPDGLLPGIYGYAILGGLLLLILILFVMQRSTNNALRSHIQAMDKRFDALEQLLKAQLEQHASAAAAKLANPSHSEL